VNRQLLEKVDARLSAVEAGRRDGLPTSREAEGR
jgi:hypothetical protein